MFIDPKSAEGQASRSDETARSKASELNTDELLDPMPDASPTGDETSGGEDVDQVDGVRVNGDPIDVGAVAGDPVDGDCRVAGNEAGEAHEPMAANLDEVDRFRRDLNRRILSAMWPRASYVDNPANFAPSSEINFTGNDCVMQCDPVDDSDPEADKADYLDYVAYLKELEETDEFGDLDGLDVEENDLAETDAVPASEDLLVRPRQEAPDEVLSPGYQVSRTVHPEGD